MKYVSVLVVRLMIIVLLCIYSNFGTISHVLTIICVRMSVNPINLFLDCHINNHLLSLLC